MARTIALWVLPVLLFGCVTENVVDARPEAGKVKLVRESDKPLRCKVIGDVHGTSRSQSEEKARAGAEADMKNHAAAMKANYALIEIDRVKPVGTSPYREIFLAGKALTCEDSS